MKHLGIVSVFCLYKTRHMLKIDHPFEREGLHGIEDPASWTRKDIDAHAARRMDKKSLLSALCDGPCQLRQCTVGDGDEIDICASHNLIH